LGSEQAISDMYRERESWFRRTVRLCMDVLDARRNDELETACLSTKNANHQQMHKEFFISCNTLLHVSTLLGRNM
jgi:hypothetical protein